jgi:hypothetical protein
MKAHCVPPSQSHIYRHSSRALLVRPHLPPLGVLMATAYEFTNLASRLVQQRALVTWLWEAPFPVSVLDFFSHVSRPFLFFVYCLQASFRIMCFNRSHPVPQQSCDYLYADWFIGQAYQISWHVWLRDMETRYVIQFGRGSKVKLSP